MNTPSRILKNPPGANLATVADDQPPLHVITGYEEETTEVTRPAICEQTFYDEATKEYLFPRAAGWLRLNETSVRRHLRAHGVASAKPECVALSPLDEALNYVQMENSVCYAGPLAGHKPGVHNHSGGKVLVTHGPKLIQPKAGNWPTVKKFIEGMLQDPEGDQVAYLYGWLKVALKTLEKGEGYPGQAMVIAGGKGCGKSLMQNLITEMFGGRSAKPYQYMTGATNFNGDLFGAEHLMVEDEVATPDLRVRRKFGSEIKQMTVNQTNRYHPKGKQAIVLRPIWRLSITLNDEPECLMVLPPIDDSLVDKIILLRAHRQDLPTETEAQRKKFWEDLTGELPAFMHWLEQMEIPTHMASSRFGVSHFHHPELIQAIQQLSPEMKLWGMIEGTVLKDRSEWTGTALELETFLCGDSSPVSGEARKLLGFYTACGTYLARLHGIMPKEVEQTRTSNRRDWVLRRPSREGKRVP